VVLTPKVKRTVTVPPATAVGALYDTMLQSALRQFFERATLDTEPMASPAPDGRLAIEPSANPAALIIRWFGTRYTLRVPGRWRFTAHEVRLAQAIGSVLAARYRAILNPQIIAERGDLFRGAIEDRYVGAFLDARPYAIETREARADRIASVIELLRVAALSSYENRPITTGVLLLSTSDDPFAPVETRRLESPASTESLVTIKSVFRLADGVRTVFLANADGRLLDVVDSERWSGRALDRRAPQAAACAEAYRAHARATVEHGHVCAVLTPSREIKVFAEGTEVFAFRGAAWHLLDLQAKQRLWTEAVGHDRLAASLFQTALDLSDARHGALFLVARDPDGIGPLVAPADRLDAPASVGAPATAPPSRRDLLRLVEGRSATELDPSVLAALASLDGATVVTPTGRLLAVGAILRHPPATDGGSDVAEGARTTAAVAASRFGPVLKVSEDGIITFFDRERVWDI
jgi:hypothetical protein